MSISSALKICPNLVIVDGEDLTPFRDVSKKLYALLRSYSWNDKVERLGLDEVWMDVTDVVGYNAELLNRNDLENSWFGLDRADPEKGFGFDARGFKGEVYGSNTGQVGVDEENGAEGDGLLLRTKLLLASHLAYYLRMKIEEEGYTTACGISTNKLLAKLVGNVNKPRNQTTLLSYGPDGGDETVRKFMGSHQLRKIPGIGGKTAAVLAEWFISQQPKSNKSNTYPNPNSSTKEDHPKEITVADLLSCPAGGLTPSKLDALLSSSSSIPGGGAAAGTGRQVLSLLHGQDPSPVKPARTLPTQISIEDTYHANPLTSLAQIRSELVKITLSLLKRMKTDLLDDGDGRDGKKKRWMARPKTLRLTTRPKVDPREGKGYGYLRVSKSVPLPTYVFSIANTNKNRNSNGNTNDNGAGAGDDDGEDKTAKEQMAQVAERLVTETLLPMFHQLNPKKAKEVYSIGLLNVCVTNMDTMEAEDGKGKKRDIKDMFLKAREFTVYDHSDAGGGGDLRDAADNGYGTSTTQPRTEETAIDDMNMDVVIDGYDEHEYADADKALCHTSGLNKPASLKESAENDNYHDCNNREKTQADQDNSNTTTNNDITQDLTIPTNEHFHIEDDDEIWDDSPQENIWQNDENNEGEEDMKYNYLRDLAAGCSTTGGSEDDGVQCPLCNHFIPLFALSAHERFHSMEEEDYD